MDERKAKSSETGLSDSEAEISVLPSDVREALLAKVGALHRQVDELTVFVKHKVPSASGLIQRAEEAGGIAPAAMGGGAMPCP